MKHITLLILYFIVVIIITITNHVTNATKYNFTALGGIPEDMSEDTAIKNGELFNETLATMLKENDTLFFPNVTFYMMGGIVAHDLNKVTISFDGTIIGLL